MSDIKQDTSTASAVARESFYSRLHWPLEEIKTLPSWVPRSKTALIARASADDRQDVVDCLREFSGREWDIQSIVEHACLRDVRIADYIITESWLECINIDALPRVAGNLDAVKYLVKKFKIRANRILPSKIIEKVRAAGHTAAADWLDSNVCSMADSHVGAGFSH